MAEILTRFQYGVRLTAINQETSETMDLNEALNGLVVVKNFLTKNFPVYTLKFVLTNVQFDRLRSERFLYNLRISTLPMDLDGNTATETAVSSHTLKPYGVPEGIEVTQTPEDGSDTNESAPMFKMQINTYDIHDLDKNKRVVNEVYKDATLFDIIAHIAVNDPCLNSDDRVVIDSPDNIFRYPNVLIPPLPPVKAFKYIQTVYNAYEDGVLAFIDFNRTYVVRIGKASDTLKNIKNRITYQYLKNKDTANSKTGSYYNTDSVMTTIYTESLPALSKQSDSNNEALGESITICSYDTQFEPYAETMDRTETTNSTRPKSAYYWRNYSEMAANKTFIDSSKVADSNVIINWTDMNPETFNPTTEISVLGTDQLDGLYKINTVSYALVKGSTGANSPFSMAGSCALRKIKE